MQNHNYVLWGYIVINTNKIFTIKYYFWFSSSVNSYIKIVKERFKQTRSKIKESNILKKFI
jgi:hypothetical protein